MIDTSIIEINLFEEEKEKIIKIAHDSNMQLEHFIIKVMMDEINIKYEEIKLKQIFKENIESFYKNDLEKKQICEYVKYLTQFIPYNTYIEKENLLTIEKLREYIDKLTNDFENNILEKIEYLNLVIYAIQFIPLSATIIKKMS